MKYTKSKKIMLYTLLVVGLLIFILPFIYMTIAATQDNATITAIPPSLKPGGHLKDNIETLQHRYSFVIAFKNTILITVFGTIVVTCVCTLAGYAFAKFKFKGRDKLFKLFLFTTMVPGFATIVPLFLLFANMGLINTYIGLILPSCAAVTSIFLMRQYMKSIPDELIESARMDGANEFYIFLKISVPIVIPGVLTVALLVFIGFWNSYLWPLLATSTNDMQTMSLLIRNMGMSIDEMDYGMRYVALFISIVPILIFYIVMQTKVKENHVGSAVK